MSKADRSSGTSKPAFNIWRLVPAAVLLVFAAVLLLAINRLPAPAPGLLPAVEMALPTSGVENPVTAVLMNFRGYDTLLEISVLTLALVAIWSFGVMPKRRTGSPSLVLSYLVQTVVPFLLLFAGYLLWAGASRPGGAFQGGAVFAGAGLMLLLAGAAIPARYQGWIWRTGLVLGLTVFLAVALVLALGDGHFLEYPVQYAKGLILLIETAALISIGLILVAAFQGGRPRRGTQEKHPSDRKPKG